MPQNPLIPMPTYLGGGNQNSNFAPDVWGGVPFAPGQGGYNSMSQYGVAGQQPSQGFGFNAGTMQGISQGLGAFQSLASIYGMFQNLGLQKKAFKFAREGTKRNFNASATAFNNAVGSKETAGRAYAAANNQDYDSLNSYGSTERVEKWT